MAKPAKRPAKTGTFMGIDGVQLMRVTYEFSQESDSCQTDDCGQSLKVFTEDAGGGAFVIIETTRWAMDHDHIDKFTACLKEIVNIPDGD